MRASLPTRRSRAPRAAATLALAGALGACSVLVNPDETLLDFPGDGGRRDAGADARDASRDGALSCPTSCDDRIACTTDRCDSALGRCVNTPDNARCPSGMACDPRSGCVVAPCGSDAACDNGNTCDGRERCVGGRCLSSTPPSCDDGDPCTTDRCDPSAAGGAGACVNARVAGCGGGAPANDLCARAAALTVASGTQTVSGTTAMAQGGVRSSCGGDGPDVWYAVTYPGGADLELEALPVGGGDPVLVVRDTCEGVDLACSDDATADARTARIVVRSDGRSSMRTLFVVVDSFEAGSEGPFTLRATVSPAAAGASCGGGTPFDLSRGGTVLHTMPRRMSNGQGSCSPMRMMPPPEEAYALTGPARRVRLNVLARGAEPVLYARAPGCMGRELLCAAGGGGLAQANLDHPGGTSLVFVDNLFGGSVYSLNAGVR